jgi:predicted secreted protein
MSGEGIGWGASAFLHNGTTLVELIGVFNLTLPNPQTDDVDVTHYKSPQRQREYIAGLIENGEIQLEMNYIAGSPTDLLVSAAKAAGNVRPMEIIVPSTATANGWKFAFNTYVKGYERAIPVDDRMTSVATCKVAGAVTEAAAP